MMIAMQAKQELGKQKTKGIDTRARQDFKGND
jgi:hypothetical protein